MMKRETCPNQERDIGEDGEIREGCRIVKKERFMRRSCLQRKMNDLRVIHFFEEIKHSYTDLINIYVQNEKQKLQVFERGGVYLATKKIGKNNPKAIMR